MKVIMLSLLHLFFFPIWALYSLADKQIGDLKFLGLLLIIVPVLIGVSLGSSVLPKIYQPFILIFIYQAFGMMYWYYSPKKFKRS